MNIESSTSSSKKLALQLGVLFVGLIISCVFIAYLFGAFISLVSSQSLSLAYNYAGGIEVGSPVRVMGIKVGRVTDIRFAPQTQVDADTTANLLVDVEISQSAWATINSKSHFYINLAGVIGEKFIEVSPGLPGGIPLKPKSIVRGEDPPRIDQLISQSYGLAGKLIEVIDKNEGSVIRSLELVNELVSNTNKLLREIDQTKKTPELKSLIRSWVQISADLEYFTNNLKSENNEEAFALLRKLLKRLEPLDAKAIEKFFQEEGIRAKLF